MPRSRFPSLLHNVLVVVQQILAALLDIVHVTAVVLILLAAYGAVWLLSPGWPPMATVGVVAALLPITGKAVGSLTARFRRPSAVASGKAKRAKKSSRSRRPRTPSSG